MKRLLTNLSLIPKYSYSILYGQLVGPLILAVELTNNCNANCIMCDRESHPRKRRYMEFELFKNIINDAHQNRIKIFQLSFYGEPLLYPHMVKAVRYLREQIADSTIIVNTNGALLDAQLSKRLLDAGMNLFNISIDGSDQYEYEQIRIGLKWEVLRRNVKDLRTLIDQHNYPAKIFVRGLNLKDYPIDVEKFETTWGPYADRVVTRDDHYLTSLQKEGIINRLLPCYTLFSQMVITVTGEATMCAYDWDGAMIYGRFPEKNIRQLWRTPSLNRKRLLHLLGMKKSIDICKSCTYRAIKQNVTNYEPAV